jgi:hypothetical protein
VVTIVRAIDLEDRPSLQVFPNHVLVGAPWAKPWAIGSPVQPKPVSSPQAAGPLELLSEDDNPLDLLSEDKLLPGTGVRVAVLDSGTVQGHSWLGQRVQPLTDTDVEQPQFQNGFLRRFAGHGTFIAGVILQCAPGAMVVAQKVLGANGFVNDTQLATALYAVPADVKVINLSLGGVTHDNVSLPATDVALQTLFYRKPRPVVVAAAGNEASLRPSYPAAFNNVIAVAALDADDSPAIFSNHGSWVNACALGVAVHSTFFEDLDAEPEPSQSFLGDPSPGLQQFRGFAVWSGTSFAASCVTGAIAATMTRQDIAAVEAAFRLVDADGLPRHPDRDLGTIVACVDDID